MGLCATKRIVALHPETCLELLQSLSLKIADVGESFGSSISQEWLSRWAKYRFENLVDWEPGAVIVTTSLFLSPGSSLPPELGGNEDPGNIFLSCALRRTQTSSGSEFASLELLSDERIRLCWLRILTNAQC